MSFFNIRINHFIALIKFIGKPFFLDFFFLRCYFYSFIGFIIGSSKIKFLSCEPLIGPLPNLNLKKIDWVIVGGESGHRPRPMDADWVLDIQGQCEKSGVAFFFKQWGGRNKKANGRLLNGKTYDEMPEQQLQTSI